MVLPLATSIISGTGDLNGALTDDPDSIVWDFGTEADLPALRVDTDGDSTATAYEFGGQGRFDPARPLLTFAAPSSLSSDTFASSSPTEILLSVSRGGFPDPATATLTFSPSSGTLAPGDCTLSLSAGSTSTLVSLGGLAYTLTIPPRTPSVALSFLSRDLDLEDEVLMLTLSSTDPSQLGALLVHTITVADTRDDHSPLRAEATSVALDFSAGFASSVAFGAFQLASDEDCFVFPIPTPGLLTVAYDGHYGALRVSAGCFGTRVGLGCRRWC